MPPADDASTLEEADQADYGVSLGSVEACFAPPPAPPGEATGSVSVDAGTRGGAAAPTLVRKAGVPPFWIEREYDTHTTKAIAFPPLFIHRTPKADNPQRFLHINPLAYGWYSKETQKRRWFSPLLFFGAFSERKSVWGAVPLLMGYRRVGEQFNFGQFPIVWYWGTKFVKNLLVAPVHYQQKAPDGFRGVSGLLVWYGHRNLHDADLTNDKRHLVVAPAFWRFSRGLRTFDISPLYVGGENKLRGLRHRAVAPLFLWQSHEFGNRKELWTMPFIRRSDKARRMNAWAVPPALVFSHRGPDRSLLSVTPLFWRGENRLKGSRVTLAGLYGRYQDPRQASTFVAPVWFRFTDRKASATTDLLLPLGFARKTPDRRMVWTILGGGGKTKDGWAAFALPVLGAAGRTDAGTRFQGLGGVLWHVDRAATADKPRRNTYVLGPLAYAQRRTGDDGASTRVGIPGLLTFGAFGGERSYQVVTPAFWHFRTNTPERKSRTVVAAGFFHQKVETADGVQHHGGLPPVFLYGAGAQRRYTVIPALLTADVTDVRRQQRLTLSPLYVRSSGPDHRTHGVLGLVWDVKRTNERHSVAFPLYYRRQIADRTLTMTPLGGRYKRGSDVFTLYGPYARRKVGERDGAGILPLVWWDRRPTPQGEARHLVVAPFLIRRRTPTDDLDVFTPLVWRREIRGERARKNLAVVPFYFRQRQPGGVNVDAGIGYFYSRDATRRTHTLIAGPGFHRLSRKGLDAGVVPFYWWHDTAEKRRLLSLPVLVYLRNKTDGSHTTLAPPFWYDRKQANGRRGWGAFPVAFGVRRRHNFTRFSVAPPGYLDIFRLAKNRRFTGHVPLLFRYQKCGFLSDDDPRCRYTVWGSAPLFLYGKDGLGRKTHAAAMLYYWDRSPEGWRLWTPAMGITNRPGKMLAWYAGPVGVRTSQTHRRIMAVPLYYRKQHRLQDSSLTLVAPPLFISRRREDRRFFEAGLVVWQFRQLHKVSTAILPPVFFHSYAYKQRRRYWVAPIFYRDNNTGEDKSLTGITPALYIQRRNGANLDFVQFPLVWHIERGENQGTFGAFAWWDIRVKGRMAQVVPGLFTRLNNAERDLKVIGPGLGWWTKGKGATEGDLHWRALFGAFGGGREGDRRYRAVFGRKVDAGAVVRTPATTTPAPTQPKAEPKAAPKADPKASGASRRMRRRGVRKASAPTGAQSQAF